MVYKVMPKRTISKSEGFTLIEMLIVIVIISVLIGVVLTGVGGFQQSARDTRRIADLKNTQNYLELYFTQCGHYPGDVNCGKTAVGLIDWKTLKGVMVPKVTSHFPSPSDDINYPYYYGVSDGGLQYTIGAKLERDNAVLIDSLEGSSNGVNCDKKASKIYCIQS